MVIFDITNKAEIAINFGTNMNAIYPYLLERFDSWVDRGLLESRQAILEFDLILCDTNDVVFAKSKFICGQRLVLKYSNFEKMKEILSHAKEQIEKISAEKSCSLIQFEVPMRECQALSFPHVDGYHVASFVFNKSIQNSQRSQHQGPINYCDIEFIDLNENSYFSITDLVTRFEYPGPTAPESDRYANIFKEYCDFSKYKSGDIKYRGIQCNIEGKKAFCYFILLNELRLAMVGFIFVPPALRGRKIGTKLLELVEIEASNEAESIEYIVSPFNYTTIEMLKNSNFEISHVIFNRRCK
jgi:GNAT superfamily N-acetyltransferase